MLFTSKVLNKLVYLANTTSTAYRPAIATYVFSLLITRWYDLNKSSLCDDEEVLSSLKPVEIIKITFMLLRSPKVFISPKIEPDIFASRNFH